MARCSVGVYVFFLMLGMDSLTEAGQSLDQFLQEENAYADSVTQLTVGGVDVEYVTVELDMMIPRAQWEERQQLGSGAGSGESRHKRKATLVPNTLWPNGRVKYEIIPWDFTRQQERVILVALEQWMSYSCVTFSPAVPGEQESKITFMKSRSCRSNVGLLAPGARQIIHLTDKCANSLAVVVHEVGHALGLNHEHMRPDRDEFVKVHLENVREGKTNQFTKLSAQRCDTAVQYDYRSVMHYGPRYFSKNDTVTIDPHGDDYDTIIGTATGASFHDIKTISHLYDCAGRCVETRCPPEGFLGRDCLCWCPGTATEAVVVCEEKASCLNLTALIGSDMDLVTLVDKQWEEFVNVSSSTSFEHDTEITAICDYGEYDDVTDLRCDDGRWEGQPLVCPPAPVPEGSPCEVPDLSLEGVVLYLDDSQLLMGQEIPHDVTVQATCGVFDYYSDYLDAYETNLTCNNGQLNGTFPPYCVPAACLAPSYDQGELTDSHGRILNENQTVEHGEEVTFRCPVGMVPAEVKLQCELGSFNHILPTCRGAPCLVPSYDQGTLTDVHGSVLIERATVDHGEEVTFRCPVGMVPAEVTLQCELGSFSRILPTCRGALCKVPSYDQGELTDSHGRILNEKDTVEHGEEVTFRCPVGMVPAEVTLQCELGSFSRTLPTCRGARCQIPSSYPGEFTDSHGRVLGDHATVDHGEEMTYRCPVGMVPLEVTLQCELGRLHGLLPACRRVACSPPKLGKVLSLFPKKASYAYRENVNVSGCAGNLEFVGSHSIMCKEDGSWSNLPKCAKFCDGGAIEVKMFPNVQVPLIIKTKGFKATSFRDCVQKCSQSKRSRCRSVSFKRRKGSRCFMYSAEKHRALVNKRGWRVAIIHCKRFNK